MSISISCLWARPTTANCQTYSQFGSWAVGLLAQLSVRVTNMFSPGPSLFCTATQTKGFAPTGPCQPGAGPVGQAEPAWCRVANTPLAPGTSQGQAIRRAPGRSEEEARPPTSAALCLPRARARLTWPLRAPCATPHGQSSTRPAPCTVAPQDSCHCQYVAANCTVLARRTTCGSAGAPTTTPISRRPLSACMHGHGLSVAKVMRDP